MQRKVLIVDDSLPLHRLIRAQLDAEDLVFHSVYDGSAAVSAAVSVKPDLILLDIDMPTMDGFEACAKIKANPQTAAIPIMFLSAESTLQDKDKAMALGAFGYVRKPFKPGELKSAIRAKFQFIQQANEKGLSDPVTGLWSKDYFEVHVREQYVLASLALQSVACVIAEIDQLATLTVRFGNKIANRAYHAVARLLSDSAGVDAMVCSLANRRFAILFRNCDRFDAKLQCQTIQQRMNEIIPVETSPKIRLTCSFGVCDNQIASAMNLIDRTASVLQRAIEHGGNRIALARSESVSPAQLAMN